jgi:hypothetical protein
LSDFSCYFQCDKYDIHDPLELQKVIRGGARRYNTRREIVILLSFLTIVFV